ncbi:MAG: hypothetical protein ACRBDI_09980 [Alphaproteobacteria bacterium]
MKFSNRYFQQYLSSSQTKLSGIKTQTDWVYNSRGEFVSPSGFGACMTVDFEKEIVKGWTSKNKNFLLESGDLGSTYLQEKSTKRSYLSAVERINSQDSVDIEKITNQFKHVDERLSDRAGHYLYIGVNFAYNPLEFNDVSSTSYGKGRNVLSNAKGYNAYIHDMGTNFVKRLQSIYRKDGSFEKLTLNRNYLLNGFSYGRQDVAKGGTAQEAFLAIDKSRRDISQKTWEQDKITDGLLCPDVTFFKTLANNVHAVGPTKMLIPVPVAAVFMPFQPEATVSVFGALVAYAAFHDTLTEFCERGVDSMRKISARLVQKINFDGVSESLHPESLKESQLKGGTNLIFGRKEVYKFSPKASDYACKSENNEMMPRRYFEKAAQELRAKKIGDDEHDALEEFLAKIHQLGVPGVLVEPDQYVFGFAYDNGVRGVRYQNPKTREIKIAAQFDNEIITNEYLELPKRYRDQFSGKLIVFDCEVDENRMFKVHARNDNMDRGELIGFLNDRVLFKHQAYMPASIKEQSYNVIYDLFKYENDSLYEDEYFSRDERMEMKSVALSVYPFAEASMTREALEDLGYLFPCSSPLPEDSNFDIS